MTSATPSILAKPKILHIEDNAENRMLVRALLEGEGYPIVEAEDGLAGIEAAIREQPSLILLDINLPGVDGYEVVTILKSFPALATTPVVAVTAYAMEGDRQRTLVAGCDGYIQKPIDVDGFPRQIAEFLAGKREQAEAREEGVYLRELNQRLVYRLLDQVEELKRVNRHETRRAHQLETLHRAVQDITSELGVRPLLERLLPPIREALDATMLAVELDDPASIRIEVRGDPQPVDVNAERAAKDVDEVEWKMPLVVEGRCLGFLIACQVLLPAAAAEEERLLKIVASQVAIAVENSRLYEGVTRQALQQQSLVEAGRLLTGTLQVAEVLQRLAELVRTRLTADVVQIWLPEDTPNEYRLWAGAGSRRTPPLERLQLDRGEGLVGWIMEHKRALLAPDLPHEARVKYPERLAAEGFQSYLGVPLLVEDESVGVLAVLCREPRAFSPEDVTLIEALATSAAAAVRNAKLYEETQRRLGQTENLLAVSHVLGSILDLGEVGRRATREMVRALGADFGGSWRIPPSRDALTPLAGYHVPPDLLQSLSQPAAFSGTRVVEELERLPGPLYSGDSQSDPRFDHPLLKLVPHRAVLLCPMRVKDEIIGGFAMVWTREAHHFTSEELRLAEAIARQSAVAIENSRLYDELRAALRTVEESQQRVVQGERLRALGEMAGGVAHDFNNVLAIIVGRAEVILSETDDAELQRQLNVIIKVALDAAQTVKRIQEFTRMRRARPFQAVNVNELIEEVIEVTRSRWKDEAQAKGVRYEVVNEPGDVVAIAGDPSEIREALANILFNALDAMPDGGTITFRSGMDGTNVFCSMTDTGAGMTEEVRQRVFDPFFTTKGERGTGLGLSVVYGIVTRHGAEIDVQSRVGEGSTFTLRFPSADGPCEGVDGTGAPEFARTARILVIDDEQQVRDALRDLLVRDGHSVTTCANGDEGLAQFEANPFDLVVTDLGMPGLSGWEIARLVKLRRPEVPVAMVTGWGDRFDRNEARAWGVEHVIAKPFRREDIRRVLARALRAAQPSLSR